MHRHYQFLASYYTAEGNDVISVLAPGLISPRPYAIFYCSYLLSLYLSAQWSPMQHACHKHFTRTESISIEASNHSYPVIISFLRRLFQMSNISRNYLLYQRSYYNPPLLKFILRNNQSHWSVKLMDILTLSLTFQNDFKRKKLIKSIIIDYSIWLQVHRKVPMLCAG